MRSSKLLGAWSVVATALSVLTLALGCTRGGAGVGEQRDRVSASSEGPACSLDAASALFVAATQVDLDYQPLRGDALVQAAEVIVRGRARALAVGRTLGASQNQHTLMITVEVEKSYKSERALGRFLYVELPRSPVVTARDLTALEALLPAHALTFFLVAAHELAAYPPAGLSEGEPLYALRTPQALVLSSPCGLAQPLAPDAPIFAEEVESESLLDRAITEAVQSKRLAKACDAEPGSPLDVASEPNWRPYAEYAAWTDAKGCLVRIDVLAERPGPSHCDWQDTRVIITGAPFGARYTQPADSRHYVRDPEGSYGDPALSAGFAADAVLPSGTNDSGFRSGELELWLDPADESAIYLKGPVAVERWPRGDVPLCM